MHQVSKRTGGGPLGRRTAGICRRARRPDRRPCPDRGLGVVGPRELGENDTFLRLGERFFDARALFTSAWSPQMADTRRLFHPFYSFHRSAGLLGVQWARTRRNREGTLFRNFYPNSASAECRSSAAKRKQSGPGRLGAPVRSENAFFTSDYVITWSVKICEKHIAGPGDWQFRRFFGSFVWFPRWPFGGKGFPVILCSFSVGHPWRMVANVVISAF